MRRYLTTWPALSIILLGVATSAAAQDSQSRLWDAAIAGDTTAMSQAIREGAQVDSLDLRRSENGRRPLNWAAWNNHVVAIQWLLAHGASVNAVNHTGFTAIHHAAENGSTDALKALLAAGADFRIPNNDGVFPIDTAREHGHVEIVSLLQAADRTKP
jgi:ankyrin repeat protein